MLLIDEVGTKQGIIATRDALDMARSKGLDLIEVAPNARPPVCKIGDWGRMKYEKSKRDADARKRQSQVQVKEVKLRPKTDDHDMEVKVTVRFRGREPAHHDIGAAQCRRLADAVSDVGQVETPPKMNGRLMHMIIGPR